MQELRPYQHSALDQLREGIRRGMRSQVLMLPTGAGKTTVTSAMFSSAVAKGKKALFIVDSLELIDQAALRFTADGMPVGIIQGDHPMTDYSKPVQVATVQSLRKRWGDMANWLKFDLVVVDECHVLHSQHEEIITWCAENCVPVIGLSATPFRKALGKHFDGLVVGTSVSDLTDDGFLVPAICYAPFIPDLKGVKTSSNGDWQEDALAEYMGDAAIVGGVVEKWLKLGENRQTLVFGANVAHSRLIAAQFRESGIVAAHVDGYTPKEEREDIIRAYRNGDIKVLCNVGVLTKGFDAPETACVVIARPTKSLMLHLQIIGRGLRPAEGKRDCIIIDHAGNCIRNGLPTEELPTTLHDGKSKRNLDRREREDKAKEPAPCVSCGYLKTQHVCPMCGFKAERRQDIESRDGELVEVKSKKAKEWTPEKLAELYSELKGYCYAHGKKEGMAFYMCKEYAGRAPRNTRQIPPRHPSDATMRIVKHLMIKRAKRKEAAA